MLAIATLELEPIETIVLDTSDGPIPLTAMGLEDGRTLLTLTLPPGTQLRRARPRRAERRGGAVGLRN